MTKQVEKTIWEQMKEAWANAWADYKAEWKALWLEYKTLIGPFIKGTASYIWQLIAGIIKVLTVGLYNCGKILVEHILKIIKKA